MKKFIIKNILGFMIGGMLFGSIGVYAASKYKAEEVLYDDVTVKNALDELYDKVNSQVKLEEFTGYFSLIPTTKDGGCNNNPTSETIETDCYSSKFEVNLNGYSTLKIKPYSMYTPYQIYLDYTKVASVAAGSTTELTYDISDKRSLIIYSPYNSYTNRGQGTYTLIP